MNIVEELSLNGIVPVIALDDAAKAEPLAKALEAGGIYCAEVTFRTDAAADVIKNMRMACPDMLVGAGTVLTHSQADSAKAAGAQFIVSPGLNADVVKYCQKIGITVIPGINNPSDVELALSLGLTNVKFFPAEASGGIKMLKAMSAPYGQVRFMPTGGIDLNNLMDYLSFKKIIAVGGSYMVTKKLLDSGSYGEITDICKKTVEKMLGFGVLHIGINSETGDKAQGYAELFLNTFGFEKKDGEKSIFAGSGIEVMKSIGRGKYGHIAIATNSVARAMYRLSKKGVQFDEQSAGRDSDGNINFIYLKGDFGGFAVHLKEV
jgi:2-dehydro-3-deoxyphosphogluconate aldolase / (4S)-4-hydroxy-2-oxoglutarate aldolase